jgi:hypothetical protein
MTTKGSSILDSMLTIDDYIIRKINGQSDGEIAVDLFVGHHTLDRWKQKVGVKRHHVNIIRFSMILEMLNNGFDMNEIARKLKLTVRQCQNIKNQFLIYN